MEKYDFCGWATKTNLKCSDGRIIMKDAFKHNDGQIVPLMWGHQHDDPLRVLGHALLENREEGVYAYGKFNDTESGQSAKLCVEHGDIRSMSIYANQLKQQGPNVIHGAIREVSLVLAGANPGAKIESVMCHSDDSDEEAVITHGEEEGLILFHEDDESDEKDDSKEESKKEKTIQDALDSMDDDQKLAMSVVIGSIVEEINKKNNTEEKINHEDSEGGTETMKTNVFDREAVAENSVLAHADQETIVAMAKSAGVGSLREAIEIFKENNESLAHNFEKIEDLFPDYKDVKPGAPELLTRDQGWVDVVMKKAHKSPVSRIRTRQADARIAERKALGYKKGEEKKLAADIKLLSRTTDPQTVYIKDSLNRDDILDITDFDVVAYQWNVMKLNLNELIALAAMIGDGLDDGDPDKIHETHIRSIWNDEELYAIHKDVDVEAARTDIQGSNTSANFGENYIYAEAIIAAALHAREEYKGSGTPDLYCTPHLLNVMLLARDLNGRRIYDSKADLAAALNVNDIYTAEQFEGKTRTTKEGAQKKLLGIFVNMADYQFGATKGGEIAKFDQFDINFNKYQYLMEARLSGALTKVKSAIVLEEPVKA